MARWAPLLAVVWALVWPAHAAAHGQGRSYCTLKTVPGGADLVLETPLAHLGPVLGRGPGPLPASAIPALREPLRSLVSKRLTARTPTGACQSAVGEPDVATRDTEQRLVVEVEFYCADGPVTIANAWGLDVDPQSEIVCAVDGSAWVFRRGSEQREIGTPPTLTSVTWVFVLLGAEHVVGGLDHVLFIVALLVAAAVAVTTTLAGLVALAGVVTGFTLGHSVTLLAAGVGLVSLDARFTESVIALSIVYVALENVLRGVVQGRTLTACLFGLVHGFGFATVLAATELPRRGAVFALLSFNVGIEVAQLAIIALLFPALAFAARRSWYRRLILVPVSLLVAALGSIWFVKRATGLEFLPWLGG